MLDLVGRLRQRGVRLSLDGDKLRCLAPKGGLAPELREELTRRKPELIAFLRDAATLVPQSSIAKVARTEDGLPLSFAQQRLWLVSQIVGDGSLYNVPAVIRLRGALDATALERALAEIVRRHETLRTTFRDTPRGAMQVISRDATFVLGHAGACDEEDARRIATEDLCRGFDLERGPLFRGTLIRIAVRDAVVDDHVLALTMHHIVSDGWSMAVLLDELGVLYESFRRGMESPLPELETQYADFASWQRTSSEHGALESAVAYWKRRLAGARELLELPADRPRPAAQSQRGAKTTAVIPAETLRTVKDLARAENATPFMLLLAAFKALLHRVTGARDVVVGSPIAGRNRAEVEKLIGFFVNTLVLRTDVDPAMTFRELVARVRQNCIEAYAHQDASFDKLVEVLRPQRDRSHHPLFQVAFVLHSEQASLGAFRSLEASRLDVDNPTEKFDLTVDCEERDGALRLRASYSTDLFDRRTIDGLLGHFATLLDAAVRAPETAVRRLPLLTAAESAQLETWGDAASPYPREATLGELFDVQVARTPRKTAVIAAEGTLSYGELDVRASRLSQQLIAAGVTTDSRVAVVMPRSLDAIVAVVAIIKAGGAYVPLDPTYPRERLDLMAAQAAVEVAVREGLTVSPWRAPCHLEQERGAWEGERDADFGKPSNHPGPSLTLGITNELRRPATPLAAGSRPALRSDNLAYIVYTSGSTGTPKGVAVPHRGVVRLVMDNDFATLDASEVLLHFAPLAFDASTLEIWGALLHGGTIVVASPDASLDELATTIRTHGVTTLWLTAGLFHAMTEERIDAFSGVRQLLAGGDVLSPVHVARVLRAHPHLRVINGYGPTESTTFTCCHGMNAADAESLGVTVPIGRPIRNTIVRVLDAAMQPSPIGVPGELLIGGDGLARGYAGDAPLTASKFVPDPFIPGARLYRTGDQVRWLPNGTIEFLGRIDQQVKIRGFRIEPGEIEAALNTDARVREAAVVVRVAANGEKYLTAFIVAATHVAPDELRQSLAKSLPPYMLPSRVVLLEAMPLTASGKIDRRRLPDDGAASPTPRVRVMPRTSIERAVAHVWSEILAARDIAIDDDFFDLGGHSLLATRMVSRLRSLLRTQLTLATVFETPTVAGLASALGRSGSHVERVAAAWDRLQSMTPDELARLARRRSAGKEAS